MSVVTETDAAVFPLTPTDLRYPIARWIGHVNAVGDVSGGSATLRILVRKLGELPTQDLFSFEGMYATWDALYGAICQGAIEGAEPLIAGDAFTPTWALEGVVFTLYSNYMLRLKDMRLHLPPLQVRSKSVVALGISLFGSNPGALKYATLGAWGYRWNSDSLLAGGPLRPA